MDNPIAVLDRVERFLEVNKGLRAPLKETIDLIAEELKRDKPDLHKYLPALNTSATLAMESLDLLMADLSEDDILVVMNIMKGVDVPGVPDHIVWQVKEAREYKIWADAYAKEQHGGADLASLFEEYDLNNQRVG